LSKKGEGEWELLRGKKKEKTISTGERVATPEGATTVLFQGEAQPS